MRKSKTSGEILFGKKEHKRQMRRVKLAEKQERLSPNTIQLFYPGKYKTTLTLGYDTISALFEGLIKEVENMKRRWRAKKPFPKKIIIKFDRRIK